MDEGLAMCRWAYYGIEGETMEISAVWLMTQEDDIVVLVEVDGKWYEIIRTLCPLNEMTISHCAHTRKLPSSAVEVDFSRPSEQTG